MFNYERMACLTERNAQSRVFPLWGMLNLICIALNVWHALWADKLDYLLYCLIDGGL